MNSKAAWTQRLYHCSVLLGSQDAKPAWHWDQWKRIATALDPLIEAARGPAGTSSTQKFVDRKGWVAFRRMGWSDKAHQKWTHGSPAISEQTNWRFLSTEVWAPTRGVCANEDQPPDVFFGIRNEGFVATECLKFNPVLFLAVAADLVSDAEDLHASVTRAIGNIVDAKLQARSVRPWVTPFGEGAMTDCLNDQLYVGLFKVGPRHIVEPSLAILADVWQLL